MPSTMAWLRSMWIGVEGRWWVESEATGVSLAEPDRAGLYDVEVEEPIPDRCTVTAWRPAVEGIAEVFHAHIVDWGYPAHSHEAWTVLIVDQGAIDYSLDKRRWAAAASTVAILPPGVIHDGQPSSRARQGFRKRCLYLRPEVLPSELIGPAVDKTVLVDPALRSALSQLHHTLRAGEEPLGGEERLALICDRLRQRLNPRAESQPPQTGVAHQLRQLLDEHVTTPLKLSDAATTLDRSTAHLVRSFTASFGVSPHAYLIGRRIDAARRLLLTGMPASRVAAEVGFYDQAHLTRHFKRHTSTTPVRYARSGAEI
jgi:AraC-like DNA-binding protein